MTRPADGPEEHRGGAARDSHPTESRPPESRTADDAAEPPTGRAAAPAALRGGGGPSTGGPNGGGPDGGRKQRAERSMVPRTDFRDYYGQPVIKAPAWSARDIAGYFFLGGLAGAGSVLAAGAQATGRTHTATALKVSSLGSVSLATAALVHDLGRPARFGNMLRVMKPSSPMSMGSWLLAGYGPLAGVAAVTAVSGRLRRTGAAATGTAALLGPLVTSYTAVLAADTAVPAWHEAHRELPYLFSASATAAAAGMALAVGPRRENEPARYAAALAAVADLGVEQLMERRLGFVTETLRSGRAGRLLRAARLLTTVGAGGGALLGRRSRLVAMLSGGALLAGSACTRFGVFAAGIASAEDPAYTVVPQRERLAARAAGGGSEPRRPEREVSAEPD